jgi:hypothetical protein
LDSAVKYNGDSLVIGFRIHCAGNTNTWGKLDGITIKRDGTLYFPAITKPPKPTGLAVNTYRTLKNVILSWAAASATPQAYLVFKNNVRIDSIAGTRLNDTILNLANGTYIFGLVARDASGSKSDTAKISYTLD